MDHEAIERAKERLAARNDATLTEAALERARIQVDALAQTAAELQTTLPDVVGDAVREGLRAEVIPVARQLAETRGLTNRLVRQLERVETELTAERHARVDDLALLVDLIASGWRAIDERLARIESALAPAERRAA